MAAPTIYRSSDTSAPVLDGTAGSLVNVLTGCLVNGYGSKAAAGWALSFSAANRGVYRQGAGNQFYLDVDDRGASGVLTGTSGWEAAVRGYETMSAVSTGTNPFPTIVQLAAAGANWRKASTADAIPRAWILIADDRTFYIGIRTGDAVWDYYLYGFGDIYSIKSADGYRTFLTVRNTVNAAATGGTLGFSVSTALISSSTGFYMPRVAAGTGTSINAGYCVLGSSLDASTPLYTSLDQNLYVDRAVVTQVSTPYLRGFLRGLWYPHASLGLNDGDLITGTGDLAGRSFIALAGMANSGNIVLLETTAWDTSS